MLEVSMRSASSAPTASRSSHPIPALRTVSRRPRAAVSSSFSPVGPSTATGRCSAWSLRPSSPAGYPRYRSRRLSPPSLRVGGRLSSSLDPASAQNREAVYQEALAPIARTRNFPKLPRRLGGSRVRRYETGANPRKPSSCRLRPRPTFGGRSSAPVCYTPAVTLGSCTWHSGWRRVGTACSSNPTTSV